MNVVALGRRPRPRPDRQAAGDLPRAAPSFISSSWLLSVMPINCFSRVQKPFQLPHAHRALLGDAVCALGEHVELRPSCGSSLTLTPSRALCHGLSRQIAVPAGSAAPWACRPGSCTGGSAARICGQHLFGRDAAIHHPDPRGPCRTVSRCVEEAAQRRCCPVLPDSTS